MQKLIMVCKIFSALNELKWWQSPIRPAQCIDSERAKKTWNNEIMYENPCALDSQCTNCFDLVESKIHCYFLSAR